MEWNKVIKHIMANQDVFGEYVCLNKEDMSEIRLIKIDRKVSYEFDLLKGDLPMRFHDDNSDNVQLHQQEQERHELD